MCFIRTEIKAAAILLHSLFSQMSIELIHSPLMDQHFYIYAVSRLNMYNLIYYMMCWLINLTSQYFFVFLYVFFHAMEVIGNQITLCRVGRVREPLELTIMNQTCTTRRSRVPRRSDYSGRRERTRPGFYGVFCVVSFLLCLFVFIIKVFKRLPVPASFFPIYELRYTHYVHNDFILGWKIVYW